MANGVNRHLKVRSLCPFNVTRSNEATFDYQVWPSGTLEALLVKFNAST